VTLHDLATLVYAHREAIIGGALAVLGYSANPPPWAIKVRRFIACLRKVPSTNPEIPEAAPITERPIVNILHPLAALEAELKAIFERFTSHLNPETAKTEIGSVLAPLKPVLDLGIQAAASEASALVVAKYPGVIGQAFGQAIQTTVTAEGAALEGSIWTPAP
jgi:hypothetical protein